MGGATVFAPIRPKQLPILKRGLGRRRSIPPVPQEGKSALRRIKKVGNFHIFEATVSRNAAERRLINDLLALFGGHTQPVMAHLIESGKLTLEDVKEAQRTLRKLERKDKSP